MLMKLLLIGLGGSVGALARYGTFTAMSRVMERDLLPLGTLAVNLLGCFLIGYLQGLFLGRWMIRTEYQVALLIGVLGGYTTFSAVGWETATMLQDGQYARATINLLANNVLGVVLVIVGYALGQGRL